MRPFGGDGRSAWGTDNYGPARTRTSSRCCLATSPAIGALPGQLCLPRHPRNTARRLWHVHDLQVLVPAASYLARTSTPGSIPEASDHARSPMSRLHLVPSRLANSSKRLHLAPACLLLCAMSTTSRIYLHRRPQEGSNAELLRAGTTLVARSPEYVNGSRRHRLGHPKNRLNDITPGQWQLLQLLLNAIL